MERYIFDIPVYRLSKDDYDEKLKKWLDHRVSQLPQELQERFAEYFRPKYGGEWLFNEVVGYIRLNICYTQICGEVWCVDAKRVTKTRRKQFRWDGDGWMVPAEIPPSFTNREIYDLVLSRLQRAETRPKSAYVDTSTFEAIGRFVDWRSLMNDAAHDWR